MFSAVQSPVKDPGALFGEKGIASLPCSQGMCAPCILSYGLHRRRGTEAATERRRACVQQRHHGKPVETTTPLASGCFPSSLLGRLKARSAPDSGTDQELPALLLMKTGKDSCCSLPCRHISPSLPSWYGAIPVWHALS